MSKLWYKSYPKEIPFNLDYEKISLFEMLKKIAKDYPNNLAVVLDYDNFCEILKYQELYDLTLKLVNGLKLINLNFDDKVSFLLPNVPTFIAFYYAVLALGGVVVNVNPELTPFEILKYITNSDSKFVITFPHILPKLNEIIDDISLEKIIIDDVYFKNNINLNVSEYKKLSNKLVFVSDLLKEKNVLTEKDLKGLGDFDIFKKLSVLQYTGGTTGILKAAMLSHFNLVANAQQIVNWVYEFEPKDNHKTLCVIPLFHAYGMTVGMNVSVRLANAMVLVPHFSIDLILRIINKYKIDFLPGVPSLYNAISLYAIKTKIDISSVRVCISGASALNQEIYNRFVSLTNAKLVEGYGLSEASPVTHINPVFGGISKVGFIGLPIPDTDAKIVDINEKDKELGVNEEGELIIKGPQVMLGYYKNEQETNNSIIDGYLYTGDIAIMDEDGYFKIVDRKKDMIIVSGFKVYPREVEEVILKVPGVLEAAVVGIEHPIKGQIVKAFVVKNNRDITESDIIKYCKDKLSHYKVPKEVEFVDDIPKNQAGKILKRLLINK